MATYTETLERIIDSLRSQKTLSENEIRLLQGVGHVLTMISSYDEISVRKPPASTAAIQGFMTSKLSDILFFLEPLANSHFALAQEVMLHPFKELRLYYPEDKLSWYKITWILLWKLHELQIGHAHDLHNM